MAIGVFCNLPLILLSAEPLCGEGGRAGEAWCHQMSNFKAKMHQIRYKALPDLLAVFKGGYF